MKRKKGLICINSLFFVTFRGEKMPLGDNRGFCSRFVIALYQANAKRVITSRFVVHTGISIFLVYQKKQKEDILIFWQPNFRNQFFPKNRQKTAFHIPQNLYLDYQTLSPQEWDILGGQSYLKNSLTKKCKNCLPQPPKIETIIS